jgi:hypothetical protein
MEQYLTMNDLWDIVDGTETEPTDTADKAKFLRRQKTARARIALHVSPSQLSTVRLENNPKSIWDELKCLNHPGGFGTHMALHRGFAKMMKTPEMPMSKWITSVRDVACQIKDLGGDLPDEEIIVVLTNSLLESYSPLVVQLDAMEESARTLGSVITWLIGEERRQAEDKDKNGEDTSLALSAKKRRDRSEITCFSCGVKGHYKSECSAKPAETPKKPTGTLY